MIIKDLEMKIISTDRVVESIKGRIKALEYQVEDIDITVKMLMKQLHVLSEKLQETYNKLYEYIG